MGGHNLGFLGSMASVNPWEPSGSPGQCPRCPVLENQLREMIVHCENSRAQSVEKMRIAVHAGQELEQLKLRMSEVEKQKAAISSDLTSALANAKAIEGERDEYRKSMVQHAAGDYTPGWMQLSNTGTSWWD